MLYMIIAASICLLDFIIKTQIEKKRELGTVTELFGGRIFLRKYHNKGVAMDALKRWPWLVRILSGMVLLFVCILLFPLLKERGSRGLKLGLSLMLGGGASNFYDRIKRGYVVDYFSFKSRFPKVQRVVYNLSDCFIFLGAILMLIFHNKKG